MSYLQYAILGLGAVAVYVLLAQGVVLIYRASGVVNFAQGAFAMVGAYIFYQTYIVSGWPLGAAIGLSIVSCAALGVITSQLIIHRLRRASSLVRLIATLAVLSILQTAAVLKYTDNTYSFSPFLPHNVLHLAGISLPEDRLWLLVIAIGGTIGLHFMTTRTKFGLATYGVSESELTAETLGWSPAMISAINWGLGGALAGLAGILIVPLDGLTPETLTLLLVPALAAALVGNFSSFGLTLLGAAIVGISESEVAGNITSPSWSGLSAAVPFVIIVLLLVVRGRSLPLRGYVLQRLPGIGSGRVRLRTAGPFIALAILALLVLPASWMPFFTVSEIAALFVLSVVLLTGYAGQLSLAQYAIGGLSALVSGRLVVSLGLPFFLAFFIGIVAGALAGLVFAIPALRTRGITLAVVTIGMGVAVYYAVFSDDAFTGYNNSYSVGPQRFLGINIDPLNDPRNFAIFSLVWVIIGCILVGNIRRSRAGRRLIAVRTNERAAAAIGVNVYGAKLYAFAVSASLAGLAGVLLAFDGYSITFSNYDPTSSITLVQESVLGGVGYLIGPFFGGQFASGGVGTLIGRGIVGTSAFQWVTLVGSVLLIPVLLMNPDGVAGGNVRAVERAAARIRRRRGLPPLREAEASPKGKATEVVLPESKKRREQPARSPAVLTVENISVRFGGIKALSDVSMSVEPGEIVGVIGPNGAGKTTLIDVVSGFVRANSGNVRLGDRQIDSWAAFRRARTGVARTFQGLELFEDLTVMDNLRSAADPSDAFGYLTGLVRPDEPNLSGTSLEAIKEFGLEGVLPVLVRELPYGVRRLVGIARAVAGEPTVLLLDEPTAGLDEQESRDVTEILRTIPIRTGIGILLVEHDMSVIMNLCSRIVVLDFGEVIAQGTPEVIRQDPRVIAAYLG